MTHGQKNIKQTNTAAVSFVHMNLFSLQVYVNVLCRWS